MRPVTVSIGPALASSANDIATSQTPAAKGGTATATFTNASASIAATNSFVAGQLVYFTTTGQLPYPLVPNQPYYVIATGLTGSAFEVSGKYGGTGIVVNTAAVGSSFNPPYWPAASGTQTVNFGGSVALNGSLVGAGAAVLATPQRVLITTADSTTKFTIQGASADGSFITETVTSNGTNVQSALDYASVTSITVNQLATAAVTVGTNGVGSTPWVRTDEWASNAVSIQCDVTGTVNYTVQASNDDPNSPTNPVVPSAMTWINSNDTDVVGATSSQLSNYLFSPAFVRVLLNSGSGSVTATVTQYGVTNR
jgi:hypothetical protein